jgi:V/A-type H+/Na+-transporting ATPase subunit D
VQAVIATRSELLARREQLELARQGRDLLHEKREQLMEAFQALADRVLAGTGALEAAAAAGRRELAVAEGVRGPEEVGSAALASTGGIRLTSRPATIMGVKIADIEYPPVGRGRAARGYTLAGSDGHLDVAVERLEAELELLLELAVSERRLRRLVDEIAATTRRVNALEYVVVPRLELETAAIQRILDERERQDRFRLKRIKARRGRRLEQAR